MLWLFLAYSSPATHPRISHAERVYIETSIAEASTTSDGNEQVMGVLRQTFSGRYLTHCIVIIIYVMLFHIRASDFCPYTGKHYSPLPLSLSLSLTPSLSPSGVHSLATNNDLTSCVGGDGCPFLQLLRILYTPHDCTDLFCTGFGFQYGKGEVQWNLSTNEIHVRKSIDYSRSP